MRDMGLDLERLLESERGASAPVGAAGGGDGSWKTRIQACPAGAAFCDRWVSCPTTG
jgi:hypothetical protein